MKVRGLIIYADLQSACLAFLCCLKKISLNEVGMRSKAKFDNPKILSRLTPSQTYFYERVTNLNSQDMQIHSYKFTFY